MATQETYIETNQILTYFDEAPTAVGHLVGYKKLNSIAVFGAPDALGVEELSTDIAFASNRFYGVPTMPYRYSPFTDTVEECIRDINNFGSTVSKVGILIVKNLDDILLTGPQEYEPNRIKIANFLTNLIKRNETTKCDVPVTKVCAITRLPHEEVIRELIPETDTTSRGLLKIIEGKVIVKGEPTQTKDQAAYLAASSFKNRAPIHLPIDMLEQRNSQQSDQELEIISEEETLAFRRLLAVRA